MRRSRQIGILVLGLAILGAGCATKDFVREQLDKKEAEIGQRIGTVEGRVGTVDQKVDREGQRIGKVEGDVTGQGRRIDGLTGRVTGVEGQVGEVGGRADAALAKAGQVDERLTRLWSKRHGRSLVENMDVQFAFDKAELSDGAQTALLTVIKDLKQNPALTVDLQGYTDAKGSAEYNLQLSQRRVEAVRRYLIAQGVDIPRVHAVGLGAVPKSVSKDDAAKQRKVSVKVMVASE